MIRELRTSKLDEYIKLLETVLNGLKSSSKIRHSLIEFSSTSDYTYKQIDSKNDPENYYHLKMFDSAIGIVRLYFYDDIHSNDPDMHYLHYAIRIYNYVPKEIYKLPFKRYRDYTDYGDFFDIADSLRYFRAFCNELICSVAHINQSELIPVEIF